KEALAINWLFREKQHSWEVKQRLKQIQVVCSDRPIITLVGDDVILPCRLDPATSADSMTVNWTRPGLDPKYIHVHQDGRLLYESQNPSYHFRTRVFVEELPHGNVSLKIFTVKRSDEGSLYSLHTSGSLRSAHFKQEDHCAASSPVVNRAEINSSSCTVVLQCESAGWYPEPELLWLDGEGKLLSAGPPETVRGPDDLYTVSSRVTVEKRHSNTFTCRVQQNNINQSRETRIDVPGWLPNQLYFALHEVGGGAHWRRLKNKLPPHQVWLRKANSFLTMWLHRGTRPS
uniref:Ig-like domain-containing protein n=1 Tax=Stegastes partitus TaxID=144197 RepID=A0A3B5BHL9_9TELE